MTLVHLTTPPLWSGMVRKIGKAEKSRRTLQHKLDRFLLAYRSASHATTEVSPAQLEMEAEMEAFLFLRRLSTAWLFL